MYISAETLEEINLNYPYNVEFSKEDADFVRIYAKSAIFGESEVALLLETLNILIKVVEVQGYRQV